MPRLGPTLFELMLQKNQQDYERQQQQDQINYQHQMDANNMLANAAKLQTQRDAADKAHEMDIAKLYGQAAGEGQQVPGMMSPDAQEYQNAVQAATQGSQQAETQKLAAQYGWHAQAQAEQERIAQQRMLQQLGVAQMMENGRNQRANVNDVNVDQKAEETKRWHDMLLTMAGMKQGTGQDNKDRSQAFNLMKSWHQEPIYKAEPIMKMRANQIYNVPNDGTGDYALIQAFAVLTDPMTGVRDAERTAVAGLGPLWATVQGRVSKWFSENGQRIPDNLRAQFVKTTQALYASAKKQYDETRASYGTMADDYGVDRRQVIGRDEPMAGQAQGQTPPRADGKVRIRRNGQTGWILPEDIKEGDERL